MLIRFDEIPAAGLSLTLTDDFWFPDAELRRAGEGDASVRLVCDGSRVVFSGEFRVEIERSCDRCLEPYPVTLQGEFSLNLTVGPPGAVEFEREHGCRADEMDTVHLAAEVVDVSDLLVQQLLLALPQKNLCRRQCRGLCPGCGADLNQGECACSTRESDSPFSILAKLKSN